MQMKRDPTGEEQLKCRFRRELFEQMTRHRQQIQRLGAKLAEPGARIRQQLEELADQQATLISAVVENVAEDARSAVAQQSRRLADSLTGSLDLHEEVQRFMQAYASQWATLQELADRLTRELPEAVDRFGAFMLKLGWPPPQELSIPEGQRLMEAYDSGQLTEEQIGALLVDFYDETQIRRLYGQWKNRDWLARRLPILESAVEAHIAGEYNLSIPTLLPQLEGSLAEAFGHRGRISGAKVEVYAGQLLRDDSPGSLWRHAKDFYLQFLLDGFQWGQSIPFLSRHAILHGADTDYGTAENSLRIILLFDYIQGATRYVGTGGGKVYHRLGCRVLRRASRDREVYRSRSEAESAKTRACTVCLRKT